MKSKLFLLISVVLFACGNNNTDKKATAEKAENEHAGHTMSMPEDEKGYADSVNSGLIKEDTLKGSPHRTAMNTIGNTHVHIEYSSPGVKGRVIWGGLVAMDKVWVAGAHDATSIRFYKDVLIDNKKIAAGTYAFFTIPGRDSWTLILNTRFNQHLADEYQQAEDVLRVQVKPEAHVFTPRLTYTVDKTADDAGVIRLAWDSIRVSLPFKTI
ncbi:MAG: DUF2911 domain-containing protein [Sphingobacteriales bacterium]|jgi:hypothetical protein|nr:DUF2911 domain-containing protein [Sphingobacteriales bacterium]OJW34642.1 MAG: hypothetical protein BGO54_07895 [Sphingobacteriales bacterium 46-32]